MNCLVVLNALSGTLAAQAAETNGLLSQLDAAVASRTVVIFCRHEADADQMLPFAPAECVVLVRARRTDPEAFLNALERFRPRDFDLLVFPGDFTGHELAVRIGSRAGGSSLLDVESARVDGADVICGKHTHSNHMFGRYRLRRRPFCLSVAKGRVNPLPPAFVIETVRETVMAPGDDAEEYILEASENGDSLEQAKFIVAAGKGIQSREGVERLAESADALGAEYGVTRPVAMSAWAPLDRMIGVSGNMAKPDLCLALGVSGSAAFYAGIEKSGFIVAVNTDPDAEMVKNADVAVIDDCQAILEELTRLARENGVGGKHGKS